MSFDSMLSPSKSSLIFKLLPRYMQQRSKWQSEQWYCAETKQHHTMFTINFGELPGSRMHTMKQPSSAALYVSVRPERILFVHILRSFDMRKMRSCAPQQHSSCCRQVPSHWQLITSEWQWEIKYDIMYTYAPTSYSYPYLYDLFRWGKIM